MSRPMMKCGHSSNSYLAGNKPYCLICGCDEIADEPEIDLTGRKMRCSDCGRIAESNQNAALFKYQPDQEYDKYYCGCYGWD